MSDNKDFVTTNEAAEVLGVTRQRVLQLIGDGRIRAQKFANVYMIRPADLANIEEKPMGRPPKAQPSDTTRGLNESFKKSAAGKPKPTKTGKTTPTPTPPGVQSVKEVILKGESKKRGGKK